MRIGRGPLGLLASLWLLAPQPALADRVSDALVTLEWQAPVSCPDGNAVLSKVRAMVSAASAERVTARGVVIEPSAGGQWHLTLETVQGARAPGNARFTPLRATISPTQARCFSRAFSAPRCSREPRAAVVEASC